MVPQQTFVAIFVFCMMIQNVLARENMAPSSVYRSDFPQQQQQQRNPLFFVDEDPRLIRYASDIKDPIIKRFKPCYYSPIQCLIKK
ncbi:unnamed protein product [Caenorhabditis angaria]|uniref:Uncharacterized protein n=1 Tax=Caenorhabditis angaria TaxID=860376 RepID=A0A9P1N9S5_9PELO|nr:unnamed protein product [Caenorhabditis angaria]